MKTFAILLCLTVLGCGQPNSKREYIRVPKALAGSIEGFFRDSKVDDVYVFGYADIANIPQEATILDEKVLKHFDFDPKTLELRVEKEDRADFEGYHNYPALTSEMQNLVTTYPDLVTLKSAGKSVSGRELWYLVITNSAVDSVKPRLLYIANMHGDETVGREVMIYLARLLLSQHEKDARITSIVNNAETYIMPSMNPDGFEDDQRENQSGVDLNRDFPDFTSDPTDTTAGRAIETADVMKFHDKRFDLALNFHGGAVVFNLPWDTQRNNTNKFGDDKIIASLARQYADANPAMRNGGFDHGVTYGYEWYEVNGGMQDWACFYRNSIHATVELSNTKYPSAGSLQGYWDDNRESLLAFLNAGLMGIHLQVFGPTANVKIEVKGLRPQTFDMPHIHRVTLSGNQEVTISAPGFKTTTVNMAASAFDGTFQPIVLTAN